MWTQNRCVARFSGMFLSLVFLLSICTSAAEPERSWPKHFFEHRALFEPHVEKIGEYPVWSLGNVDNWAANSMLVEGRDGLIIFDTGLSREHGEALKKEIRAISDKPVVAIFYSHHHPDHFNGTSALVSAEDVASGKVKIYAWENFRRELASEFGATGPIQVARLGYYSGMVLGKEERHFHGCCGWRYGGTSGYIEPTDLIAQDTQLNIAGVRIDVFYTGGEAVSEFGIYLPDFETAIIADEMFHSVPNIYTIRGAKFRDVQGYLRAIDTVLELNVQHLLGTHLRPMHGRENIQKRLTKYRDLVQWIHDQSVRYINKGYTTEDLKQKFRDVPPYLENGDFSREIYGSLEHIAPQIYAGYIGYYNGDPIEYRPTPPKEFAVRHIKLMGGREKLLEAARQALAGKDPQWSAELTTYLITADNDDMVARRLKATAFRELGYAELNTTWRSWFLTGAKELDGELDFDALSQAFRGFLPQPNSLSVIEVLEGYRYQVNAEKAKDSSLAIAYRVTDDTDATIRLRNSVILVEEGANPMAEVTIILDRATFNRIMSGALNHNTALSEGSVAIEGNLSNLEEFWSYMDPDVYTKGILVK